MKTIDKYNGTARVVIDNVSPVIDGGEFPVKRPEGEVFHVDAHVIADGHDHLDVKLQLRMTGSRSWQEVEMRDLGNDEFSGEVLPDEIGVYEFRVSGWADTFRNWHIGFIKKSDSGDPKISVEIDIGVQLVTSASERAKGSDAKQLAKWASFLSDRTADLLEKSPSQGVQNFTIL